MNIDIYIEQEDKIYEVFTFKPTSITKFSLWYPGAFFDFETTKGHYYELKGLRQRKLSFEFAFTNKVEFKEFFYFWLRQKHSFKKFWCPCWINQFELCNDIVSGTYKIYCKKTNFTEKINTIKYIFLFVSYGDLNDGLLIIRKVNNIEVNDTDNVEIFTLNKAIDKDIKKENVAIAGEVILARFTQEQLSVNFNFIKNCQEFYIKAQASIKETQAEY